MITCNVRGELKELKQVNDSLNSAIRIQNIKIEALQSKDSVFTLNLSGLENAIGDFDKERKDTLKVYFLERK